MRLAWLLALVVACSCATAKTVIEIPPCADRVEVAGQAARIGPQRFELDHTFDWMLSKTEVVFRSNGNEQSLWLESNQPDPLRLFFGVGGVVVGGLLLSSAAYDLSNDAVLFDERPFYATLFGSGFVILGAGAAMTGWHPQQSYVTFPNACPRAGAATSSTPYER